MGTIEFTVPDELEVEFRWTAKERFGDEGGSISKAGVEALKTRTVRYRNRSGERTSRQDPSPVDLLDGIAADTELAKRAESGVQIKDEIGRHCAQPNNPDDR